MVFRKILVPTDFSETAETALYYGVQLARQFAGELHIMHVCEDPMQLAAWPVLPPGPAPEIGEEAAAIRALLKSLIPADDRTPLKAEVHVIVGQPTGLAISQYAAEHEFELIVMGTHGRGALAHALMGSVAEKVVRSAPCPVLTIRHSAERQLAVERLQETSAVGGKG